MVLPGLGGEWGIGPAATAWARPACTLPMAAVAIPAGRWVDRADGRSAFLPALVGVAVVTVLTAVGSLVPAGYMPIVVAAAAPEQRGRAIGYVVTIMTVGGLAGAPLGGLVAGAFSRRSVFLMKLPVVAVALWLGWRSLRGDGRGLPVPDRGLVLEAVLLGGAITSVLPAFEDLAWLLVVASAVWWARLPGSQPVLALVRRRLSGQPLLTLSLVSTLGGVVFFLVPHHVTDVLGGSPEDVGVALLVFVAGVAALAVVSGSLTDRYGPWPVATSGSVVAALAAGLAGRGEAGFRAGVAVSTAVAVVAVGVLAAAEQR